MQRPKEPCALLRGEDGKYTTAEKFTVRRGVIQGNIVSPVFFILTLDALVKKYDTIGQGISVDDINEIRVLGYADDAAAAMVKEEVTAMTERLTNFADKAVEKAGGHEKELAKTFTQHVRVQEKVRATTDTEIKKKENSYTHASTFAKAGCTARFKTKKGMLRYKFSCRFGYRAAGGSQTRSTR